jgi:membrane protease YdiL (CAAX protease family)
MPAGYDPIQQVIINSLVFVYWPRYQWHLLAFVMVLTSALVWAWRRRRAKRMA